MKQNDELKIRELLQQSLRPVNQELQRDLWPQMLHKLQQGSARVPWFDWALVALLALWCCLMPGTISVLLYHL
jgi:hypothetical protein